MLVESGNVPDLNLRLVVALDLLGGKVCQAEGG
jgi:hypothetical protein